jgi:hypothetical protein
MEGPVTSWLLVYRFVNDSKICICHRRRFGFSTKAEGIATVSIRELEARMFARAFGLFEYDVRVRLVPDTTGRIFRIGGGTGVLFPEVSPHRFRRLIAHRRPDTQQD